METRKVEYKIDPKDISFRNVGHYFVDHPGEEKKEYYKISSVSLDKDEIVLFFGSPAEKETKTVTFFGSPSEKAIILAREVEFYTVEFSKDELQVVRSVVLGCDDIDEDMWKLLEEKLGGEG